MVSRFPRATMYPLALAFALACVLPMAACGTPAEPAKSDVGADDRPRRRLGRQDHLAVEL